MESAVVRNRFIRSFLFVLVLAVAIGMATASSKAQGNAGAAQGRAPVVEEPGGNSAKAKGRGKPSAKLVHKAKGLRDQYIVVLDDGLIGAPGDNPHVDSIAESLVATYGGKLRERFKHAINGFSVTMTEAQAQAMSQDTLVAWVEQEAEMTLNVVQSPAVWGLDRIDQRVRTLTNSYSYSYGGAGVNVYVVDSGIKTNHVEFGGRAVMVKDYILDGRNGQDCTGHGTHVAGTIGGARYGVAKSPYLYGLRVFDCYGKTRTNAVLSAVNWITAYHRKPAVVNMSLGGPTDYALDTAVTNSVNRGITYVVAAGNEGQDACSVSPARAPGTITVGATNGYDQRAIFTTTKSSNWGACLDIWAPGLSITSAGISSTTEAVYKSGTSMASPHVAGAAAIYLSTYPGATPAQVRSAIVTYATTGRLTGIGSTSPNRLLYSLLRP